MWTAYYDIDRTVADHVGAIFGAGVRGVNLMVALTDHDRLAIGRNEKRRYGPMLFERGEVDISLFAGHAEMRSLAGPNGLERAVVGLLTPTNGGAPFRIQIATSGFDALVSWQR